jgi:hypothetical protein
MTTVAGTTDRRDRMAIIAVWLIGLGSVFLIKELANWTWGQAWPLWIMLLGVGSAASALLGRQGGASFVWSIAWPVAAVVVGLVLLGSTTGALAVAPTELLAWWPVVVIAIGAWFLVGALFVRQPEGTETLSIPLGGAAAADVRIRFGGGELFAGPAQPGELVAGRFEGGVEPRSKGPGAIELEPRSPWPFGWSRPLRWDLGLTTAVPVDLRLETGANRSAIDLAALHIRRLEVQTGASETRIRLPAGGATVVRAEAGVAALKFEVPAGVAARVRSKMALGETSVDTSRFPRTADGWSSPDFESSPNRVEIDVQGGLGSVRIV